MESTQHSKARTTFILSILYEETKRTSIEQQQQPQSHLASQSCQS